jgi:hypothetical protein
MTTSIVLGAMVAAAVVANATVRADERMRAGNYELTTTVTVGGQSSTDPVTNHCADASAVRPVNGDALSLRTTAEQAARTARLAMKDYSLRGNTQAYTLVGPAMSITTTTTYGPDSVDLVVVTTLKGSSPRTVQVRARRTGDCP